MTKSENVWYFAIWNILGTYFTIYLYIFFHCERWMSCCMAIQRNDCAPSEYWDKHGHSHNLIRVITVRMKKPWILIATHWAHSEDSCQTGWMPRLIWVFAGYTDHFACFVMLWLKWSWIPVERKLQFSAFHLCSFETFDMSRFIYSGNYGFGWQIAMLHNTLTVAE